MNFHKSMVFGIGVSDNKIVSCAHILGYEATSFPFVYLGVLVGSNMSLKRNWKSKTLSFGGRLNLVKSVL